MKPAAETPTLDCGSMALGKSFTLARLYFYFHECSWYKMWYSVDKILQLLFFWSLWPLPILHCRRYLLCDIMIVSFCLLGLTGHNIEFETANITTSWFCAHVFISFQLLNMIFAITKDAKERKDKILSGNGPVAAGFSNQSKCFRFPKQFSTRRFILFFT